MKPELSVISDDDEVLSSIVKCITDIDCSKYFSDHIGKSQSDQKRIVTAFQAATTSILTSKIPSIEWHMEHRPSPKTNDSIDIFGKGNGFVVVIELDKNRADQVTKKFVSRMAILPSTRVYFISLCYPGTKNMSRTECTKYFGYCSALAQRMSNHYAGFTFE
ncbi:MAG: hypothetical protein WBO95_09915 [Candidatus Dechloromonas phosphoritropha]